PRSAMQSERRVEPTGAPKAGASMLPPASARLHGERGLHPRAELAVRIRIAARVALEVAQQQIVAVAADDRVRKQRDLAAARRRVDDEARHRIAGREAPQPLDQLDAAIDGRPKMARPPNRIALIQVVGPHADLQEALEEPPERIE